MSALPADASAALAKLSDSDARAVLMGFGLLAELRSFDRDRAQRHAALLLSQRCPRAQIRDRLMQRFAISERSAYRAIDAAMQSVNPANNRIAVAGGGHILFTPTNQLT